MLLQSYKDLKFWQTAKETSLLVVKLIEKLPSKKVFWIISDQLLRATFSIGANIAEGFGKYKGKEYSRNETEYWLELLKDIVPGFSVKIDKILSKNKETVRMLTATVKTLRKNT